MKLISSRGSGNRAAGKKDDAVAIKPVSGRKRKPKMSGKKKAVIVTCFILGVIILFAATAAAAWRWEIEPLYSMLFPRPDDTILATPRTPGSVLVTNDPEDPDDDEVVPAGPVGTDADKPIEELRNMDKVTFLVLGADGYKGLRTEGGGNTDVILVASFDMEEYTLDIASIPRDTIVNVPWSIKKINSVWANMNAKNRGSSDAEKLTMEDTKEHFANFLGFNVDFWIMLDMAAFVELVNAMPAGGVRVNVPTRITLREPSIGMNVTLNAGEQTLNGMQALALMRYRGYGDGDFGRIEAQHIFLKAVAEQMLARKDSLDIAKYAEIFLKNAKTDMDVATISRIAREMLKLSSANINFYSASCTVIGVTGVGASSYVYLDDVNGWLEITNILSPFYEEITPLHVSILTLNENKRFYVTDDNWQGSRNWGGR